MEPAEPRAESAGEEGRRPPKIVLTGGPGGGKSSLTRRVESELGDAVVIVPEVATSLLGGGLFPQPRGEESRRILQRCIHSLQEQAESAHALTAPGGSCLVLDRGLLDGAAYWPEGTDAFFQAVGGTESAARDRYDAVLFLESAARGGFSVGGDNPARAEDRRQARALDDRLRALWEPHPRFVLVAHQPTLEAKMAAGLAALRELVHQLAR